jgi:hypothetical protein
MNRHFELAKILATIAGGLFVTAAFFASFYSSFYASTFSLYSNEITLTIEIIKSPNLNAQLQNVFEGTKTSLQKANDTAIIFGWLAGIFVGIALILSFVAGSWAWKGYKKSKEIEEF